MARPWRIAIVGSGPRGLMVTERLAVRLREVPAERQVEIHLLDELEVGCGRIFRSDQPEWFLMNTTAGQITIFSGGPDGGPARAGSGPSFGQWWSAADPAYPGPGGYAPRALYGRYLRFVLDAIEAGLPGHARLLRVRAKVVDLEPLPDGYRLALATGDRLRADRVVLATGHARHSPGGAHPELAAFAACHPGLDYIAGDSPADMPLDAVPAGAAVGVLGLGLSFYDVMIALTLGRGGRFTKDEHGELAYLPSGAEPVLLAGSRCGVPLPAKGANRKPPGFSFKPAWFTAERVRRAASAPRLNFAADVLPWLIAEVELVYYGTALRQSRGERAAAAFAAEASRSAGAWPPDVRSIALRHGAPNLIPFDFELLAHPFAGRVFGEPAEFDRALVDMLRRNVREAERGNVDSPLMAALDVIRDTRWVVRELADFGGLQPASHRDDFLGRYVPASELLVAGPPPVRVRQVLALMARGLLRVVGPEVRVAADPDLGTFTISSQRVAGSWSAVDFVIDARVLPPALTTDPSPLVRNLRARGLWTEFVNRQGDDVFRTGGVAVTTAPFHPVGTGLQPDTGMYVLGIPAEYTRWFTQVGSARPGPWGDFVKDADAIAAHALAGLAPGEPSAKAATAADGQLPVGESASSSAAFCTFDR